MQALCLCSYAIIFAACTTSDILKNAAMVYEFDSDDFYCRMTLRSDSSFEYVSISEGKDTAHGKWSLQGDTVVLNTFHQRGILASKERVIPGSDSIKFVVEFENGSPASFGSIMVNGRTFYADSSNATPLNAYGSGILGKQDVKFIFVEFGGEFFKYEVTNPNANSFDFVISGPQLYMYFEHEKWLIYKHALQTDKGLILKRR